MGPPPAATLSATARSLVAAARDLFARKGVDVPVEEITHHAGVGMGTLYRHFSTKTG
jgi:AcrR family transcriptional regulator